jgi:dynein intermediate chain
MESDGLVLVWNMLTPTRPEFVYTCQSEVLTCRFSDFHHHMIIGGTYSGQIVLWDAKSKSCNPILKTPLSAGGHTHPVTCSALVGSENAHQLVTSSNDGKVCFWQLDMLAVPQESLELAYMSGSSLNGSGSGSIGISRVSTAQEVGITCMDFPSAEKGAFWVGTEEGAVYHVIRNDRAGIKSGIHQMYAGHFGAVTGISFHPHEGLIDFSDLFVTTSIDWTVKLWKVKKNISSGSSRQLDSDSLNNSFTNAPIHPIFSFDQTDDYVFDVAWSPSHPAVFGTVDGSGNLDLWNLNVDTELYTCRTKVSSRALNKLTFDREGTRIAVGSADGSVYVYDLGEVPDFF